ncbi:MAG: hypothetical protein OXC94_10405, partial [Chloroflexi bacterium]|nr:hypothetical protein [Chloroflexota bacterium]
SLLWLANTPPRAKSRGPLVRSAGGERGRRAGGGAGGAGGGAAAPPGAQDRVPLAPTLGAPPPPAVPAELLDQLADGGRLVIPVGPRSSQELRLLTRRRDGLQRRSLGGVRFVPLVGRGGYEGAPGAPPP